MTNELPPYVTILNGTVQLIGAFNCDVDDLQQSQAQVSMFGYMTPLSSSMPLPQSAMCYCANCGVAQSVSLTFNPVAPRSDNSNLTVLFNYNRNYLSRIVLDLSVKLPYPNVVSVAPLVVPASGGTEILVTLDGFDPLVSISACFNCFSDPIEVELVALSETEYVVYAPPMEIPAKADYLETILSFIYSTGTSDKTSIFGGSFTVTYYKGLHITSVAPQPKDLLPKRSIYVQVQEPAVANAEMICHYESESGKVVETDGKVDSEGCPVCILPAWASKETVALSLSYNGQNFSNVLVMELSSASIFSWIEWVVLAAWFVIASLLTLAFGVAMNKRFTVDGYMHISQGNMIVNIEDVHLGKLIGEGTYGKVYKGTWRGALVAVKKLNWRETTPQRVQEFKKEVALMSALSNPNILLFLGSAYDPPNIIIVTEFMSRGDLHSILHDRTLRLEWPLILEMLCDAAKGMLFLHTCSPPVIHRDLKSRNLLVDDYWRVKICDFGLSTVLIRDFGRTLTACGTPSWSAPEVLKHMDYTSKADVYSYSIVMWECLTRSDPYRGISPGNVIYSVSTGSLRPPVPRWCPPQYRNLMVNAWHNDPLERPDFDEVLAQILEMKELGWTSCPAEISYSAPVSNVESTSCYSDDTTPPSDMIFSSDSD